jgi:hypothetical protein
MAVEARMVHPVPMVAEERLVWRSRALAWVVTASTVLNIAGIWWGVPRDRGWAVDEIDPLKTIEGISAWFSRGWYDVYPPLQHYLLAIGYSPIFVLDWIGVIDTGQPSGYTWLMVAARTVSLAMAAGVLVATSACGSLVAGRRAGLFAATIVALTAPFVYYAKTANVDVPYLFWFAVSLVFYLRVLLHLRQRDFVWFAVSATLAVCTKDQAYGLYALTPIPIVVELWRFNARTGSTRPFWRAVVDRRMALAGAVALALFVVVQNVVFNVQGFTAHVQFLLESSRITPPFESTLAGRWSLIVSSIELIRRSLGWPLFLACLVGVALQVLGPESRRSSAWLAIPAVSYGLTFINAVGYTYDRFLLPICVILAVFGGACLDWLTRREGSLRRLKLAATVAIFSYSTLYAATVDVLMISDSRYAGEEWLQERVDPGQLVGTLGHAYIQPRLSGHRVVALENVEHLAIVHPDYVVVNADYFREGPVSDETASTAGQVIEALQRREHGYELVARFPRTRTRWSWLPGMHPDLAGERRDRYLLSNLFHISPTIEIYKWPYPEPSYDAWLQMPGLIRAWLLEAHGVPPPEGLLGHHLFRWREERVPADEIRRRIFAEAGKRVPDRP